MFPKEYVLNIECVLYHQGSYIQTHTLFFFFSVSYRVFFVSYRAFSFFLLPKHYINITRPKIKPRRFPLQKSFMMQIFYFMH
jgi:hypothetical protein